MVITYYNPQNIICMYIYIYYIYITLHNSVVDVNYITLITPIFLATRSCTVLFFAGGAWWMMIQWLIGAFGSLGILGWKFAHLMVTFNSKSCSKPVLFPECDPQKKRKPDPEPNQYSPPHSTNCMTLQVHMCWSWAYRVTLDSLFHWKNNACYTEWHNPCGQNETFTGTSLLPYHNMYGAISSSRMNEG